jgi:hypothetical protein
MMFAIAFLATFYALFSFRVSGLVEGSSRIIRKNWQPPSKGRAATTPNAEFQDELLWSFVVVRLEMPASSRLVYTK